MNISVNPSYSGSYAKPHPYSGGAPQQQQTAQPHHRSHHRQLSECNPSSSSGYPFGYTQGPYSSSPSSQNALHQVATSASHKNGLFESSWPLYSVDWAHNSPPDLDLVAVTTYTEDVANSIQVLQAHSSKQPNGLPVPKSLQFSAPATSSVPYPCTQIAWSPPSYKPSLDIMTLITTGDCLRIWNYQPETHMITQQCALSNKAKYNYTPPITNFDWNTVDPSVVITSSIDTTCTIWDLSTLTARTQLIAHDSEVYDVTFVANSTNVFGSVGADGSVRIFDQRALDHSTIIYDPPSPTPLVKIEANPCDANSLAILGSETNEVYLIDIRMPGGSIAILSGHKRPINSIKWAPPTATALSMGIPVSQGSDGPTLRSARHLLMTGSDDCQSIIWNASTAVQYPIPSTHQNHSKGSDSNVNGSAGHSQSSLDPKDNYSIVAAYTHDQEINGVTWNKDGNWVAVAAGKGVQAISL